MMATEVELIVQDLVKSDEFKKAVKKAVENEVSNISIDASNIDDLDSAVEDIINKGNFEADVSITFSS